MTTTGTSSFGIFLGTTRTSRPGPCRSPFLLHNPRLKHVLLFEIHRLPRVPDPVHSPLSKLRDRFRRGSLSVTRTSERRFLGSPKDDVTVRTLHSPFLVHKPRLNHFLVTVFRANITVRWRPLVVYEDSYPFALRLRDRFPSSQS